MSVPNPLIHEYPQFFDLHRPGFGLIDGGFRCGRGWDAILRKLLCTLAALGLPPDFRIEQVKEKFGTLRVYHNGEAGDHFEAVEGAIALAEEESGATCEVCGKRGRRHHDGTWASTRCDACAGSRIL